MASFAFVDFDLNTKYFVLLQSCLCVAQVVLMLTMQHGAFCSIKSKGVARPLDDLPTIMIAMRIARHMQAASRRKPSSEATTSAESPLDRAKHARQTSDHADEVCPARSASC